MRRRVRHVDWRWSLVRKVIDWPEHQARYHISENGDEWVERGYDFMLASERGFPTDDYPEVEDAYDMALNDPDDRTVYNGAVLGGAPIAAASLWANMDPLTGEMYEKLFYDVRPHLDKPGWICARLFGGTAFTMISGTDRKGQHEQMGWLTGWDVYRLAFQREPTAEERMEAHQLLLEHVQSFMAKLSIATAFVRDNSEQNQARFLAVVRSAEEAIRHVANTAGGEIGDQVEAFLTGITLGVADPSVEANLDKPAREPRAFEVLTVAEGN